MGGVTAYFDLDGTLLDASSEKASLPCSPGVDLGEYHLGQQCGV